MSLTESVVVRINTEISLPTYATSGSAAFDLVASKDTVIHPGETKLVRTGLFMEIPEGYFGMVCSRSGLALKRSVFVLNAPGIIDSDYRGEIGVILFNAGQIPFFINSEDRIAQMIILPFSQVRWDTSPLSDTDRGVGGFGSTGE